MRRILFALLRLGFGIALLSYLIESKVVDLHPLFRLLPAWPLTIAAVALLSLDLALMAWRLCWLFRPQGFRLSFGISLRLNFVSSFFATFLPGRAGGDLAKLFYAARRNSDR